MLAEGSPDDILLAAAATLRRAASTGEPCEPVRDLLGHTSIADAYAVQRINVDSAVRRGARQIGWKVGLTNPLVQRQLGVDQPDFGAIFANDEVGDSLPICRQRLMQPKVEAEVALVLDADLARDIVTASDVLRATAFVLPAIEVVDSRIERWDIGIVDTIADRASSGMHVLGPTPTRIDAVDLRAVRMRMCVDGAVVSEGTGAECLGHPVNAVVWLANTLVRLGQPLRAGDLVLTGALGPMVDVTGEATFDAELLGLGSVRAHFVDTLEEAS